MVNESEKNIKCVFKIIFFDELVHDNPQFTSFENTEKEMADILLNFGDVIIAIQS